MDNENGVLDAEIQENDAEQRFLDQQKRAEKAESEAKALKEKLDALTKEPDLPTKVTTTFDDLADNLAVLKPLESDEVEELRKQAKELGVDPIKFAQSPAWKAQLDIIKANRKAEDSTPSPSFRTAVFDGKSFEQVIKDENSSPETRQAAFIAQRDALLKRGVNHSI